MIRTTNNFRIALPLAAFSTVFVSQTLLAERSGHDRDGAATNDITAGEFEGAALPESLEVVGIVRDFQERSAQGGHPDFEQRPDMGFGHYSGNVATTLGDDRKPVFTGLGSKVMEQYFDSSGRPICYTLFDESRGDVAGSMGASSSGGIKSSATFEEWYTDKVGVNVSSPLALTLKLQDDGQYVFDDRSDDLYRNLGGFFPIDDEMFGNSNGGGPDHNFHFTFELHMAFTYDVDGDQHFKFIGDDDVWVFINDQLVIDLGGVHTAVEQFVELDRLGLEDGENYRIDFFFAERHRTQSNFRIETNIPLQTALLPSVSAAFD